MNNGSILENIIYNQRVIYKWMNYNYIIINL